MAELDGQKLPFAKERPIMSTEKPARLMSLDAYRGFVMLLMASSGLALTRISGREEVLTQFDGTQWANAW